MNAPQVEMLPTAARVGTVVLLCLVGLAVAASGPGAAQESVNVSVQPAEAEVEENGQTTLQVVVEGAGDGVGVHDLEISLADGDVAEITDIETINDPVAAGADIGISDDGTTAVAIAAMGPNSYAAADEIPILELTVRGLTLNGSTEVTVLNGSVVGTQGGDQYETGTTSGATVQVVEETDDADGSGPGFGIVGALAALFGIGYLLSGSRARE